jgi:hypothetical protein
MRVYSGSSSSGEMNSAKEETYRIARSLGIASSSRVIVNVDYRAVGLLPNQVAAGFADACVGAFSAPEVERDLLKVPNSSLIKAVNFHDASVSILLLICAPFAACCLATALYVFHFDFRRPCSLLEGSKTRG